MSSRSPQHASTAGTVLSTVVSTRQVSSRYIRERSKRKSAPRPGQSSNISAVDGMSTGAQPQERPSHRSKHRRTQVSAPTRAPSSPPPRIATTGTAHAHARCSVLSPTKCRGHTFSGRPRRSHREATERPPLSPTAKAEHASTSANPRSLESDRRAEGKRSRYHRSPPSGQLGHARRAHPLKERRLSAAAVAIRGGDDRLREATPSRSSERLQLGFGRGRGGGASEGRGKLRDAPGSASEDRVPAM